MTPRRLLTFARTLWYLKPAQVRGQIAHALGRGARRVAVSGPPPEPGFEAPKVPWLTPPPHARWDGGARVELIGREVSFAGGIDWAFAREGPLFAFHLHQFDWARDPVAPAGARLDALESWVTYHDDRPTALGWGPFVSSLRAISWIKMMTTPGALPREADTAGVRLALASSLETVAAHPETHILANHYLWNLLALVFGGVAMRGPLADGWLAHAPELVSELAEQVGRDGLHYERSPMYHALLLENLLDILDADASAQGASGRLPESVRGPLAEVAARMLGALPVVTHPDGEIALFGDAAFGIAHAPADLANQGEALGLQPRAPEPAGLLRNAGFVRLEAGPFVLIATAAPPAPSYQPGHAHCDALSFELSVAGQRVVTDTGVCEYLPGTRRDIARATRSHATVEVEGHEQAEVWAAHRVGGRPDVGIVHADPPTVFEAVCAGWATPEVLHRRRFEVTEGAVTIRDDFDAPAARARLHLPLAPGLEPVLDANVARLALPDGGRLEVTLPGEARWEIVRRPYYPEFGREVLRAVLVGEAGPLSAGDWSVRLA